MQSLFLAGENSTVLGDTLVIFISFLVLLLILKRFAVGPVLAMMEKREATVNQQLDNAKQLEEKAVAHEEVAHESISAAQEKAQGLLTKAKETGEKIKDDAAAAARQETIRVRQEAQKAIEIERSAMLAELTAQVGDMSVELTKRLLKRELTDKDHQALINDFIEGLDN